MKESDQAYLIEGSIGLPSSSIFVTVVMKRAMMSLNEEWLNKESQLKLSQLHLCWMEFTQRYVMVRLPR